MFGTRQMPGTIVHHPLTSTIVILNAVLLYAALANKRRAYNIFLSSVLFLFIRHSAVAHAHIEVHTHTHTCTLSHL